MYKDRVIRNIEPYSTIKTWPNMLDEWAATTKPPIDYGAPIEVCQFCSQDGLRYHFEIINLNNNHRLWTGSHCIQQFDIALIRDGQLIKGEERNKAIRMLKRSAEYEAKFRKCMESLQMLGNKEEKTKTLLAWYAIHKSFTPEQMAYIEWRMNENWIPYEPSFFKVRMRKSDKDQIIRMEEWKYRKIKPFLSKTQAKKADQIRTKSRPHAISSAGRALP